MNSSSKDTMKKHLSSVLVSDRYPTSFAQKITKTRTAQGKESMAEFKSTALLPYVQGVLESRVCVCVHACSVAFHIY